MSQNRSDFSKSMQMIVVGVTIFSCFTFGMLLFSFIDNIFFEGELSTYFRTRYPRYMFGFIAIPIFGGGAFIAYWATRSNLSFMDAYDEKLSLENKTGTENAAIDYVQEWAKEWANSDSAFAQLFKRFNGYLKSISGSGEFGVKQAIDIGSSGKSGMFFAIFIIGIGILPFILSWVFTIFYVEQYYQIGFSEAIKANQSARPDLFLAIILIIVLGSLFGIYKFIRSMVEKVLKYTMNLGEKALNTEEVDLWDRQFKKFISDKHQKVSIPWRYYAYPILIVCSALPFAIGLVLLNNTLLLIGGSLFIMGIIFKRLDNGKGIWFKIQDQNTLLFGHGFKKSALPIGDIEEVIVHYQSIKNKSILLSSETALVRSLMTRAAGKVFDSPELIPSTITFFNHQGNGYTLPLRFMSQKNEGKDSHQLEFFFAYWLKSNGFSFELAESNEDAGDWRAVKQK